jgi:hypothetical protein
MRQACDFVRRSLVIRPCDELRTTRSSAGAGLARFRCTYLKVSSADERNRWRHLEFWQVLRRQPEQQIDLR